MQNVSRYRPLLKQILFLLLHINIMFPRFEEHFPLDVSLGNVKGFAGKQKLMCLSQEVSVFLKSNLF